MRVHIFRALTWAALLLLVLSPTACKEKPTVEPDVNQPASPPKSEAEPERSGANAVTAPEPPPVGRGDEVLVTVDDVNITAGQLDEMIQPYLDRLAKQAANLPPAFLEQQKKVLRDQALQEMIKMQLLDAKVKQAGITVSDEELDNEIAKMASLQKPPITTAEFRAKLESFGYDFQQFSSRVRTVLAQQKLIKQKFPDQVKVTEAEARQYYEQNKAKYDLPEQVRASHILIKPDPNSDPNQAGAAAKAKAEQLLKQIKEGADFAALAKANSACPSASRGGDLDFFSRGEMVPAFEKAAFVLDVNQVSDVVETKFGYHIIKVTDRKEAKLLPFEQVKDEIINELAQKKLRETAMQYIKQLESEADIVYPPGKEPQAVSPVPVPGATPVR